MATEGVLVADALRVECAMETNHHSVADRPSFHVMPTAGWMNDPNGPLYYDGRYHM